jgi:hypothetical protein
MHTLPLALTTGHLFVTLPDGRWLLDTGAPGSFGATGTCTFAGEQFTIPTDDFGLDVPSLSAFVGVPCAGLLGADVLGRFDHVIDVPRGTLTVSTGELSHVGQVVPTESFMGIPIVTARVGDDDHRMFFDTGAQLSYLQPAPDAPGGGLARFPAAGRVSDFYPGFGPFETDTHQVPVLFGGATFTLRVGTLPELLGMTLLMAGTTGIVGNELLRERAVGYFPRRGVLVV